MRLSNKSFDVLKWIAIIALPAIQTLWLTLGDIWNFPHTVEIGATIAAVAVFLGALLGVSHYAYKKGDEAEQTTYNSETLGEMMDNEDQNDTAKEQ